MHYKYSWQATRPISMRPRPDAMRPRSRPNNLSSRPQDGSRLVLGTEGVQGQKLYLQMNEHFSTFYAINNNCNDLIYSECLTLIIMLQILGLASAEVGWAIRYCPLLPLVSDCSDICLAPETDSKSIWPNAVKDGPARCVAWKQSLSCTCKGGCSVW